MATPPSLTVINNYLATRKDQFDQNIYARFWRSNPFASLFKKSLFVLEGGRNPSAITSTYELPTAYPFSLPNLALDNGTNAQACDITPTTVKSGNKTRAYQLEYTAYQTETICLTDLQFAEQLVAQVTNKEKGLKELSTVFLSDWYRVKNIGMINMKVSTTSATAFAQKSDALYDFSTLTLPTVKLNWTHLNTLYDYFVRRGAGEFAVGQASGQPVFSLSSGPGIKRDLFQNTSTIRDTVNWGDPMQNFTARGINTSVNGFIPNVDDFAIRYAADGTTPIYPTINQNTSTGRESVPNPNYLTVANGGQAVYEVVTITMKDIYEVQVRPIGPLAAGKAKFNPTNYAGEVQWINNADMGDNVLGNKGFYRLDFQLAAKPVYPEFGVSIFTLAVD